jgi:hypothetical protein
VNGIVMMDFEKLRQAIQVLPCDIGMEPGQSHLNHKVKFISQLEKRPRTDQI